MANIKSAKKRIRQTRVHTFRNRVRRSIARTAVRRFMEALKAGDHDQAFVRLKYASGRLDRAAQKGAMHRNNAARKKSQIWRRYNQARNGAASS
ncbi:MAG: 30S ribosomal protein S20 [Thermaerobacter sp.]|nr:30S ribosomal protein S20 [Thermaerobacter sp.]